MSSAKRFTAPVKKTMRRSPGISRTWRKNSTPAAPRSPLAWLLSKPGVAAPIIGPSRQEQLDDLLQAVDLTLSPEQIDKLEAPYQPHPVVGFK
ncbi:aldo/keto reductase [Klebsiella pneumoniae subsp. pneumoniae]|nr:aldo/keto reductase [Klebsiella pneumoniae subsp. pneumoniae]